MTISKAYLLFFYLLSLGWISCSGQKRIPNCASSTYAIGKQIFNKSLSKFLIKDTFSRNSKALNLLDGYNSSCNLNLDLDKSINDATTLSIFFKDSLGKHKRLKIEVIKFFNSNEAKKIYSLIEPKTVELNNILRERMGDFCVWDYELQIHNIQIIDCFLILINKQGEFTSDELNYYYNLFK